MRVLRWMIIALGIVGGAVGLGTAGQAAPLPVAALEAVGQTPLVAQARWHHRRHWHRRHWHHHRHWHHRRHWHRRHHWHHRHHWRRHYGWGHRHHHWGHRHHGWHRPYRVRTFY
ncbi:hypothetical protein [Methylobacterium sp. J-068]|uniref:hypothetical protein n=1 Tax=Methylobacterium sp. J-068 TaxID=2836649 RepID=UPI001FBB28D2|nr:hypothetical protein [Methylobacterium sp. J-068]MCJ2035123.1 hypothetical protein [Methylobacterium sp. J-068]